MHVALSRSLAATIALSVPLVAVGNGLWLLLGPWLVDLAYALPGFPDDAYGLDRGQRTDLATVGLASVRPFGDGVEALRAAELPTGEPAFGVAEVRHMTDVRAVIAGVLTLWGVGVALGLAAAVALYRRAGRAAVERALRLGGLGTIVAMAAVGLFALVAFDAFFTVFHGVFFEGDSWRFDDAATLRRLYPYPFWWFAGTAIGLLVAAQAGALALLVSRRRASP